MRISIQKFIEQCQAQADKVTLEQSLRGANRQLHRGVCSSRMPDNPFWNFYRYYRADWDACLEYVQVDVGDDGAFCYVSMKPASRISSARFAMLVGLFVGNLRPDAARENDAGELELWWD